MNDEDRLRLLRGNSEFQREGQLIRAAIQGKGGFEAFGGGFNLGGKKGKPQSTRRLNIRIDKKPGGYQARVSVGALFGKKKDYVSQTLTGLFVDLEASAKRVFATGVPADLIPEEDLPISAEYKTAVSGSSVDKKKAVATSNNETSDKTECEKCGAEVRYGKFCTNCGEKAPAKPMPEPPDGTIETTTCPNCGVPAIWDKHCIECGGKIPAAPKSHFCGECGVSVSTKFCKQCGAKAA